MQEAHHEYGVMPLSRQPSRGGYDAIILAVAHHQFIEMTAKIIRAFGKAQSVVFDVKDVLPKGAVDERP